MFAREVLVRELFAIDAFSASAVEIGEVAALNHELRDDSVENGVGEPEALFHSAELTEVFGGLGNHITEQADFESFWLFVANLDLNGQAGGDGFILERFGKGKRKN